MSLGFSRKVGFRSASKLLLSSLALVAFFALSVASPAQSTRRPRRESSANRKARIARTVAETYGHRYEVAGGGGYERYRSGQYLQQNNEVTFWASTLYSLNSLNSRLGVLGEVRGAYGKAKIGNLLPSGNVLNFNPEISEYNFMAGPNYRLVAREKFGLSAFVEGGVTLGKFAGDSKGLTAAQIGVWQGDYAAAFSAGLNFDYNLFPNVAVRLTPTYLGSTFGGSLQNSKGLNVGVVYRFGRTR